MRTWFTASFAPVLLLAAGCASSETAPPAEKPADAPAAAAAPQQPPRNPQTGAEWEELINKLKSSYEITEQQKTSQADEHYRLAERYYQAGDYEKASLECEKATQLSPNHAPARALFMEVQFILGQGKVTNESQVYDKYMKEALVRHQQTMVEIDTAYMRGTRHFNLGEYDQAEREFRKILEYAKWLPTGVELESRRKQALDMLDRTKSAGRDRKSVV